MSFYILLKGFRDFKIHYRKIWRSLEVPLELVVFLLASLLCTSFMPSICWIVELPKEILDDTKTKEGRKEVKKSHESFSCNFFDIIGWFIVVLFGIFWNSGRISNFIDLSGLIFFFLITSEISCRYHILCCW